MTEASNLKPDNESRAAMEKNVRQMYQYIYGNWFTMLTYVYAELDIADLLRGKPRTAAELADITQTDLRALERFLRCAGALGFHTSDSDTAKLSLTDLGLLLCAESPISLKNAARLNGADYRYRPWGELLQYVKSGSGQGISPTWENGSLEYLDDKPELLDIFEKAMTDLSKSAYRNINENRVIAETVDFSRFENVIDIGCGNGTLLEAILSANRLLKGTLFDLENVLENVSLPPPNHPNAGRVEKVSGNFLQKIPAGYDAYLMKNVIHNHPEYKCRLLLENIRNAMRHGENTKSKRLLMFEMIVPENGEENLITKLTDLNMNLLVGGMVGTRENYEYLLNETGFELLSVTDLPGLERKSIEAAVRIS